MIELRDQSDIGLRIEPESHLYNEDIFRGLEDPDSSPRIDIKCSWIGCVQEDIFYGIEAKIVLEKSVKDRWGKRYPYQKRARYIETGIDSFVNGQYGAKVRRGCIVGYVVEGCVTNVVNQLNHLLSHRGRMNESLGNRHEICNNPNCYHSSHIRTTDGSSIRLYHVMLDL
jgi:hypothetical protein